MNRSPSALRSGLTVRRPDGSLLRVSESASYPNFDPFSVFRYPRVVGYWQMNWPGKAYVAARAVDGESSVSLRPVDEMEIADRVDAGVGTPEDRLLRRHVLTFHVRPAADEPSAAESAGATGRGTRGSRAR